MYEPLMLQNFKLFELVSPEVMDMLGSNSWSLFNRKLLVQMDKFVSDLKEDLGCTGVVINNWKWHGNFTQSGFRERNSGVGSPKSQHRIGNAFDLKFKGITLDQALEYLIEHQGRYPAIKRYEDIEHTRSSNEFGGWLHIDGKDMEQYELYCFKP